ncbi:MAG: mechanosensitive ion channel [Acidobacteriota bacterium]
MKASQKLMLAVLLVLVTAAVAGLLLTRGTSNNASKRPRVAADETHVMNEHLLTTAQRLSALAATHEEQEYARDAVRLADRDVDMAFAEALNKASQQPVPSTSKVRALAEQVTQLQSAISTASREIKAYTAESAHARGNRLAYLQGHIELAQAELALDKDELSDARQDLASAGGGNYNQLERLWKRHEATQHSKEAAKSNSNSGASEPDASFHRGLIAGWRNWLTLRDQQAQLQRGANEVSQVEHGLAQKRQALQQRIQAEQTRKEELAQKANAMLSAKKPESGANPKAEATTALSLLHQLSLDEKDLANLTSRVRDLQQLNSNYQGWIGLVEARERAAMHRMIEFVLWIILAGLAVFLAGRLIDRALSRVKLERMQRATLRTITNFTMRALAALIILLVIFGPPNNMSTIVGLAGAGLTVSMKDFIVSFFGWFILMSRHGIRAGDWVEINGVTGEVIDITLFRTVLLETGNWNEPGHPTGRTVSFLNLFAVEGHYFNFTTSGQWLWDEIKLLIPWGVDPYPIVAKIEETVQAETGNTVKKAEQEWQRATRGYTVKTFSAAPNINLKTVEDGVEVTVQYICTAIERFHLRLRLSRAAVSLITEGKPDAPAAESAAEFPSAATAQISALPGSDV